MIYALRLVDINMAVMYQHKGVCMVAMEQVELFVTKYNNDGVDDQQLYVCSRMAVLKQWNV